MPIIKDIMYTTNHECLITVDNEKLFDSSSIVIFNNNNFVKTAKINSIGYKQNLNGGIKNPIILIVDGISIEDINNKIISKGMTVENEISSPLFEEYKIEKSYKKGEFENSLGEIGIYIHDEQGDIKSVKDVLDDASKMWNDESKNTKED